MSKILYVGLGYIPGLRLPSTTKTVIDVKKVASQSDQHRGRSLYTVPSLLSITLINGSSFWYLDFKLTCHQILGNRYSDTVLTMQFCAIVSFRLLTIPVPNAIAMSLLQTLTRPRHTSRAHFFDDPNPVMPKLAIISSSS